MSDKGFFQKVGDKLKGKKIRFWSHYHVPGMDFKFSNNYIADSEEEAKKLLEKRGLNETFNGVDEMGEVKVSPDDPDRMGWMLPSKRLELIMEKIERDRDHFDSDRQFFNVANFFDNQKLTDPDYCNDRDNLIHGITYMAYLATASKVIDPIDFLHDNGMLHGAIHFCNAALFGHFGYDKTMEMGRDLVKRLAEAEKKIPGWT